MFKYHSDFFPYTICSHMLFCQERRREHTLTVYLFKVPVNTKFTNVMQFFFFKVSLWFLEMAYLNKMYLFTKKRLITSHTINVDINKNK